MDSVIRGLAVYLFLLLIFRVAGKRALSQTTTFDLVLLLIISEVTQQAMVRNDHSLTNGFMLIVTLIATDIFLSVLKRRFPRLGRLLDDAPLVIVRDGKPLKERMAKARVTQEDILASARQNHGLENMDQVRHAVVETDGEIAIIPERAAARETA